MPRNIDVPSGRKDLPEPFFAKPARETRDLDAATWHSKPGNENLARGSRLAKPFLTPMEQWTSGAGAIHLTKFTDSRYNRRWSNFDGRRMLKLAAQPSARLSYYPGNC
jgi:hypothetical protein